jgi:Tol biopolymer transport system component/DNA-binding winged helix-turn-helix (wHTH) protein
VLDSGLGGVMSVVSNENQRVQFGSFEVDMKSGELRRNGTRIRLQEQPFQILALLLERPGEVVTREELQGRLWPADTYVDFDHSLNAAVRRLRDALGDSAENPRFVETVARRGYRLLVPVVVPGNGAITTSPLPEVVSERTQGASFHRRTWWIAGTVSAAILVGAGLFAGWWLGRKSTTTATVSPRQLTANPSKARVLTAAISPDGKLLAFADKTGIYLRQVQTGETHPIAVPDNVKLLPNGWFPDGAHLLAVGSTGPKDAPSIWNASILGGSARKLADDGSDPAVSPDGSLIAFLRGSGTVKDLWLMQADGSNPHRLLEARGALIASPAWAPDGRHIAILSGQYHPGTYSMDTRIDTVSTTTGLTETILVRAGLNAGLAWTRTGRLIFSAAESQPTPDDHNLWFLNLDTGSARPVGAPIRITRETGSAHSVSTTADGKRLAFFKSSYQPDVYVSDVDPRGPRLSTPKLLTLDEREDYPFAWTPDSRFVIFVSNRDGENHIFRQAADQASAELLVGGNERLQIPRLAPGENTLLYLVLPRFGDTSTRVRLMRVPVAGGPPQLVLEGDGINNQQCTFAPATLCLFSVVSSHQIQFFTFDPVTGKSQEVPEWKRTIADYYKCNWTLSPDGRTLAISTGTRDESAITLKSTSNGSERVLRLQSWAGIDTLDWASDSRSLWVSGYTYPDASSLINLDLHGHTKTVLEDREMKIGWAIPSPDGRRLALWKGSGESNVWLIDSF